MFIRYCWALLIFTSKISFAASDLESLVERALARSDQIVAQSARIEEKQEAATQAGAWQNPAFQIGAGAKLAPPTSGPVLQVGLSQLFFFPGKQSLRTQVLNFEKSLDEIRLKEAELAITMDVLRLAYEVAINQRKAQFAENRRKRFELVKAYVAGHMFASPQQKTTSIIVQQKIRNISADEKQIQGALQATLQQLKFYTVDDNSPNIQVPWLQGQHAIDGVDWASKVAKGNFELAEQRVLLEQASAEKSLASKEVLPDLSLSAFYNQETAGPTERIFGLGLSLPIPSWNLNRSGIRSTEHKIKAEKYQLSLKERKVDALLQKLLAEITATQKIVIQYPENTIANLESELQTMEKEFRRNRVDFLLFLELDIQAAETVWRVLDAQLSYIDKLASLYFMGRDKNLLTDLVTL